MAKDLRTTLSISAQEAQVGTTRTVTLPNGRQTTIAIPPFVQHGQELWFPNQIDPEKPGEPPGALILTINISYEQGVQQSYPAADATFIAPVPSQPAPQIYGNTASAHPPSGTFPVSQTGMEGAVTPPPPPVAPPQHVAPSEQLNYLQSSSPFHNVTGEKATNYAQIPSYPYNVVPGYPPQTSSPSYTAPEQPLYPPTPVREKRRPSTMIISIIGIVFLLIVAATGGTLFVIHSQEVTAQTNATATAHAHDVSATAVVNTSLTATATVVNGQAQATASVVAANPNRYAPAMTTLAVYEKLDGNDSDSQDWTTNHDCSFSNSALHVVDDHPKTNAICAIPAATTYSDFTLEVQFTIIKGNTGGILFRSSSTGDYDVFVDQTGYCQIVSNDGSGSNSQRLFSTDSVAVVQGYNQTNTLGLVAKGSTITLYINHQKIGTVNDSSHTNGDIGLLAATYQNHTDTTEATFTNLRIWT